MSTNPTEPQGGQERRRSREMSLKRGQPPTQVPGYEPERFLGVGAYGEVWVARERNTGRRVAIKFYAHRGGLDWSLLSREVEKLAFLFADRYVVQLLGVGWEAEPPYYIMEYLDRGSLAERLEQGPLPLSEAVRIFHDVAVGLVHAHGKGVLHCDLKPANILLDQDGKPRLADFGQSRLSCEQAPALGTLFFMAPEQADLDAVPDARWDVYALGALLYCMLTGSPPHRSGEAVEQFEQTPDLTRRLARYRQMIEESPPPSRHRQVRGVDRALAEIIDRCLAVDPEERFPNVQAVLDVLDARAERRARRPAMLLGTIGPALVLLVVAWVAWGAFSKAVDNSEKALTRRALQSNRYAARFVARAAADELAVRWGAVHRVAASKALRPALEALQKDARMSQLLDQLSDPDLDEAKLEELRRGFRESSLRKQLQDVLGRAVAKPQRLPKVTGWFLTDKRGVQVARVPERPAAGKPRFPTIGKNFGWRSYFQQGAEDRDDSWRPGPEDHINETTLSAVFQSQATYGWMVAVSIPLFREDAEGKKEFLGVVALMVEVGEFVELKGGDQQFAVLVDWREGENKGVILQHPLFDTLRADQKRFADRFKQYRLEPGDLPEAEPRSENYQDPLAAARPEGDHYNRRWLAQMERVRFRGKDTGLVVVVQEAYDTSIASTLDELKISLARYALIALLLVALVILSLWRFALRMSTKY